MTNPLLPSAVRSAGRVVVWTLCGLVVLGVLASAWVGVRGYLAYGELRDAERTAEEIRDNLTDTEATSDGVAQLVDQTESARSLTSDPVWRAAERLPWVGDQLAAVSTTSDALAEVASSALRPVVDVAQDFSVDDLRPVDGRIDIAALGTVQGVAADSAERVALMADRVDGIDRAPLLAPLARQIDDVAEQLRDVSTGADAIDRASQLMPAMLGQNGPRNYLLLFQNNAEARSLGGLVGAMALLRTEGGAISLEGQTAPKEFPTYDAPVLPLGPERSAILDDKPARFISNVTQVPDFAVSAQLAQTMWERQRGQRVDGVIAVDPVALSYVLEATGPLTLPGGAVITSENAVQMLLNEPYLSIADPVEQDEFFRATAAAVFDALLSGAAEPGVLLDVLSKAVSENRVLLWNANEAEQAVLDGTALQGRPLVTEADRTRFGVFVNDGTPSKMSYYQQVRTGASWCAVGTGDEAVLEVALRNDAPADAASLPVSVTGPGTIVPRGIARTVSYLYLPEGSEVVTAESTGPGVTPGFGQNSDAGRPVLTWETQLAPGEEAVARIRVRTPRTSDLDVFSTPTVPGRSTVSPPACSVYEAS